MGLDLRLHGSCGGVTVKAHEREGTLWINAEEGNLTTTIFVTPAQARQICDTLEPYATPKPEPAQEGDAECPRDQCEAATAGG